MSFTLTSNIPQLTRQLHSRAARVVVETAFGIEAHIKTEMAAPKSGREYGNHVASAPGEAPAIDTGLLVNSIQVEADGLAAVVGTNAEYAPVLEFGGVHITPRPFFGPAFDAAKPEFARRLKEMVT